MQLLGIRLNDEMEIRVIPNCNFQGVGWVDPSLDHNLTEYYINRSDSPITTVEI